MKFSIAALAVLATSAVAAPSLSSRARLERRVAQRAAGTRRTQPLQRVEVEGSSTEAVNPDSVESPTATETQYSSNWAGVVIENPPSGTFTAVSATFTVPKPTHVSGSSGTQSASAWVGIDGDTASNSILQTGIDFSASSNGAISYDAWYEWYPDYAYDFSGISFSPGDTVALSVVSSGANSGTAVIKNLSKGKTVTKTLSSSVALQGLNAEWIVEDYEQGSSLVPLVNFGTVTFTNAIAKTSSGQTVSAYPGGGQQIAIRQNNKVYTTISGSGSTVTVKYTG